MHAPLKILLPILLSTSRSDVRGVVSGDSEVHRHVMELEYETAQKKKKRAEVGESEAETRLKLSRARPKYLIRNM